MVFRTTAAKRLLFGETLLLFELTRVAALFKIILDGFIKPG
jgi:hypothetical protein